MTAWYNKKPALIGGGILVGALLTGGGYLVSRALSSGGGGEDKPCGNCILTISADGSGGMLHIEMGPDDQNNPFFGVECLHGAIKVLDRNGVPIIKKLQFNYNNSTTTYYKPGSPFTPEEYIANVPFTFNSPITAENVVGSALLFEGINCGVAGCSDGVRPEDDNNAADPNSFDLIIKPDSDLGPTDGFTWSYDTCRP